MVIGKLFQRTNQFFSNLRHIAGLRRYYKHLFKLYGHKRYQTQSWYWFISLPQSGTSSLLSQAGFTVLSEDPYRAITIWYKDKQLAFECHFQSEQQAHTHLRALHWLRFIDPVDHLILTCTPSQLSHNHPLDAPSQYALTALSQYRSQIWLVITQSDQIAGFNESSRHLTAYQTKQPNGFTLEPNEPNWIQHFRQRFADFIQNLQQTLLTKLHHEYDLNNRRSILELPQQMTYYQYPLQKICQSLCAQYNIKVSGIYWTSSMADYYTQDVLRTAIQPYVPLRSHVTASQNHNKSEQSLFIDYLFNFGATSDHTHHNHSQNYSRKHANVSSKRARYLLSMLGLLSIGVVTGYILLTQTLSWTPIMKTMKSSFVSSSSSATTEPRLNIKKALTKAIQKHEGMALYEDLKVYTMLHNPKLQDPSFIIPKLQQYFPHVERSTIKTWLTESSGDFEIKPRLISQARRRLRPKAAQYVMRLVRADTSSAITLLASQNALTHDKLTVSKRYTRQQFHSIWQQQIPHAAKQAQQVLAITKQSRQKQLVDTARQQYLQNYRERWLTILHRLSQAQPQFHNLDQATENLAQLPQLFQTIFTNLRWPNGSRVFQQKIAQQFPGTQKLSDKQIKRLSQTLTKWKKQHTSWQANNHPQQQVFHYIKQLINGSVEHTSTFQKLWQRSQTLPQSLKRPLRRVLRQDWLALVHATSQYINQKWQQQITPHFKPLVDCYPFDSSAQKEISLNQLQSFFGNQGQFISFFEYYLQPFINTHGNHWRWRQILGQPLSFSKRALEELMQAYMINRMFFSDSEQNHSVNVKFTLIPVAMAPQTQQAHFQLGSQDMSVTEQDMKLFSFHWPDDNKPEVTRVTFTSKDKKQTQEVKHGVWGLFRLLDEMHVTEQNSSDRFKVLFDLNGQSVKIRLLAEDEVNPFNLSLLHGFSLPKSLKK